MAEMKSPTGNPFIDNYNENSNESRQTKRSSEYKNSEKEAQRESRRGTARRESQGLKGHFSGENRNVNKMPPLETNQASKEVVNQANLAEIPDTTDNNNKTGSSTAQAMLGASDDIPPESNK